MDIPDPLSPHLPIIHCFQQILRATSCIGTKLLYVGSSWTSCLCSSMWRGPQAYITYELVLTSPAVSRVSASSNFDSFCDGWLVAVMSIVLMKENNFTLKKKATSRQYPTETVTATDYADDPVLLVNAPTQAKSLLYNLQQVAKGIGLYMNSNRVHVSISILNGKLQKFCKLVHIFW